MIPTEFWFWFLERLKETDVDYVVNLDGEIELRSCTDIMPDFKLLLGDYWVDILA
jgi:hypothetical protein